MVGCLIVVLTNLAIVLRVTIAIYLPNSPFTATHHRCRVVEEAFNNVSFKTLDLNNINVAIQAQQSPGNPKGAGGPSLTPGAQQRVPRRQGQDSGLPLPLVWSRHKDIAAEGS